MRFPLLLKEFLPKQARADEETVAGLESPK